MKFSVSLFNWYRRKRIHKAQLYHKRVYAGTERLSQRGGTGQLSRDRVAVYLIELDGGPDAK